MGSTLFYLFKVWLEFGFNIRVNDLTYLPFTNSSQVLEVLKKLLLQSMPKMLGCNLEELVGVDINESGFIVNPIQQSNLRVEKKWCYNLCLKCLVVI